MFKICSIEPIYIFPIIPIETSKSSIQANKRFFFSLLLDEEDLKSLRVTG